MCPISNMNWPKYESNHNPDGPQMRDELSVAVAKLSLQVLEILTHDYFTEKKNNDALVFSDPKYISESISAAVLRLVQTASYLQSETYDEIFKAHLSKIIEALEVSNIALEASLHSASHSNPMQMSETVKNAKNIQERAWRLLKLWDEAEKRKIKQAAEAVKQTTPALTCVTSLDDMVNTFRVFVESVVILAETVGSWCQASQHLTGSPHIKLKQLQQAVSSLRLNVSLVSSAVQTYFKYPSNEEASRRRDTALGEVLSSCDVIITLLEAHVSSIWNREEEAGYIMTCLDKLIVHMNSDSYVIHSDINDVVSSLEAVIGHCVTVATSCQRRHMPRPLLLLCCRQVLTEWREHELLSSGDDGRGHILSQKYNIQCQRLTMLCSELRRHLEAALLHLFVDGFKDPTGHLEVMITSTKVPMTEVEPKVEEFCEQAEKMCHIARLIAASTQDAIRGEVVFRNIEKLKTQNEDVIKHVLSLKTLLSGVSPLLDEVRTKWTCCMLELLMSLDMVTDANVFVNVSEIEIMEDIEVCKDLQTLSGHVLSSRISSAIGLSQRVAMVMQTILHSQTDSMFRCYFRKLIKHLHKVTDFLRTSSRQMYQNKSLPSENVHFLKHCCDLLKVIDTVKQVTGGEGHTNLVLRTLKELGWNETDIQSPDIKSKEDRSPSTAKHKMLERDKITGFKSDMIGGSQEKPHHEVNELVQAVTSAAVSGNRLELNRLCNDLLVTCNVTKDVTESILAVQSDDTVSLRELSDLSRDIQDLTPQLVDAARRVLDCDTYHIELMHEHGKLWSDKMKLVESWLDKITMPWRDISAALCQAPSTNDTATAKVQKTLFGRHCRQLDELLCDVTQLCNSESEMDQRLSRCSESLQQLSQQLTDQNTTSQSAAQLTLIGRQWAAQVYCLTQLIDTLVNQNLGQVRGFNLKSWQEGHGTSVEMRQSNMQMKHLASFLVKSVPELTEMLEDADDVLKQTEDMYTEQRSKVNNEENIFSHEALNVLQIKWAHKLQAVQDAMSKATVCYDDALVDLYEKSLSTDDKVFAQALAEFNTKFFKCMSHVSTITERISAKSKAEMTIITEALSNLKLDINDNLMTLSEDEQEARRRAYDYLVLQWATRCHQLIYFLSGLRDVSSVDVSEVRHLLVKTKNVSHSKITSDSLSVAQQTSDSAPRTRESSYPASDTYKMLKKGPTVSHKTPERPAHPKHAAPRVRFGHNQLKLFRTNPEFTGQWRENAMVSAAKEIARHLHNIALYHNTKNPTKTQEDLFDAVKAVVEEGKKLGQYAQILMEHSLDESVQSDLKSATDHVDSLLSQYNILSSVKAATQDDRMSEKVLSQTANNLIGAVNKLLRSSHTCFIKGLREPSAGRELSETERNILSSSWEVTYDLQYMRMSDNEAPRDEFGLKRVSHEKASPLVLDLVNVVP